MSPPREATSLYDAADAEKAIASFEPLDYHVGRVVHHLEHMLPDPRHTVVLTGYQAVGTRGRQLAEGATEVKMFGLYVPVRAEVVADDGISVHDDGRELLDWLKQLPVAPETVYVVHGEQQSARSLAARVRAETGWCVVVPELHERVRVG